MKVKMFSILTAGLLALMSFAASASDTAVANANVTSGTASGCGWTFVYSSGGGLAPQGYDLYCSGAKVVSETQVNGSCYFSTPLTGYYITGSACNAVIWRTDAVGAEYLAAGTDTLIADANSTYACSWSQTSGTGGGYGPASYNLMCNGNAVATKFTNSGSCGVSATATGYYTVDGVGSCTSFVLKKSARVAKAFKDCNYGGYSADLNVGTYTTTQLAAIGISNDDLSSLQVVSGYRITLFQDNNFSGNTLVQTSNNKCFSNFNDVTSSIKVEKIN